MTAISQKPNFDFSEKDLQAIRARGGSVEKILSEIETFSKGFPPLELVRPCTAGDGICVLNENEIVRLGDVYAGAALSGRAMKFVPASGAASRMFKDLIAIHQRHKQIDLAQIEDSARHGDPVCQGFLAWARHLPEFAFYGDLRRAMKKDRLDLDGCLSGGQWGLVLEYLLSSRGLNYAHYPKGLIKFHRYEDHDRSAFEEHLAEVAAFVADRSGTARIHFTIPAEPHGIEKVIREQLEGVSGKYAKSGIRFELSFSCQKLSSDTIAVELNNQPFRDEKGGLVFWPGGHGVLLENLAELKGDILFIKNIDNVAPDRLKEEVCRYKKALGGYLVETQNQVFFYLGRMAEKKVNDDLLAEMIGFAESRLSRRLPLGPDSPKREAVLELLFSWFNRPLRVCGMVPNRGEPGGGPFWVRGQGGEVSLQIVEESQVDARSPGQKHIWAAATHFNPVDLVCGIRDYLGRPFDLSRFSDPNTGFISHKSRDGRELKALELPGLWNGAMGYWNTVFVEVPVETFHPVKTVTDLLRREHLTQIEDGPA